ncbi:MAG: hypothetical protein HY303_03955, partial [Candidatus Wallbacteria bacterium]|nr:hypothetical protein [Candidatus Wallbacteria bacterium]
LRFYTRASGRGLLVAAGYRVQAIDLTPHLARAVWPLLKGLFHKGGQSQDPGAVLRSPAYRRHQRFVEPVETALARIWPGMLACQFVFEATPAYSLSP